MDEFQWGEIRIEDAALAGGFVQLPAVVVFDRALSAGAKITYGALLWYAWKFHRCPEQKVMAAHLGVSLRTIQGHVAELERTGYIEVIQLGLGRPNAYIIKTLQNRQNALPGPLDLDPQKTAGLARNSLRNKDAENCGASSSTVLDIENIRQQQEAPVPSTSPKSGSLAEQNVVVASHPIPTTDDILARLLNLGVARSTAKSLLKQHHEMVYRWVVYTEQKLANGWVPQESPAAWIVSAIRSGDWVIPSWYRTPEEQQVAAAEQERVAEEEQRRRQEQLEQERHEAEDQRRAIEAELGVGERTRETWERVKELLLERDEFSIAYHSAYLMPLNGRVATVATSIPFFREVIEKRSEGLRRALSDVAGKEIETIEVRLFEPTTAGSQ